MPYDLIVIGSGWAGFNAAVKAKDSGLNVVLFEKAELGGICLNKGCIPTKTLIQTAKKFSLIKKSASFGINVDNPILNHPKVIDRKNKIIEQLKSAMKNRLSGIEFVNSQAKIVSSGIVVDDKGNKFETKYILIATGSAPVELPGLRFDAKRIISSDEALDLSEIPAKILIIGAGVIGCEFANLFSIFGSFVTLIDKMPQILPGEDSDIAKKLEQSFKKRGIRVFTNADFSSLNLAEFDKILVCVGRRPVIGGLGLDNIGLNTENGFIVTDNYQRTNIKNILSAGDCSSRIMLAHYAAYQANIAVDNLSRDNVRSDTEFIPACIFTGPEIASIGIKESLLSQEQRSKVEIKKFDFLGSSMARIMDETDGFVKILIDKPSGIIIGASIIGANATELIGIFTVAVNSKLTVDKLKSYIFAHPTLSEAIIEAL
ncbi:MAG: dihydrolipoyl dehydrogenase [Candidatus Omnitrophota bacterium]|jgi:dihydrolipoamide dehydrogenase|nr:MAG: dihydrolipoyl dehydrogenase [Candidatus Omnitrophota bacterium]